MRAPPPQQQRSPSKVEELASQLPLPPEREPYKLSFERRQRVQDSIEPGGGVGLGLGLGGDDDGAPAMNATCLSPTR